MSPNPLEQPRQPSPKVNDPSRLLVAFLSDAGRAPSRWTCNEQVFFVIGHSGGLASWFLDVWFHCFRCPANRMGQSRQRVMTPIHETVPPACLCDISGRSLFEMSRDIANHLAHVAQVGFCLRATLQQLDDAPP